MNSSLCLYKSWLLGKRNWQMVLNPLSSKCRNLSHYCTWMALSILLFNSLNCKHSPHRAASHWIVRMLCISHVTVISIWWISGKLRQKTLPSSIDGRHQKSLILSVPSDMKCSLWLPYLSTWNHWGMHAVPLFLHCCNSEFHEYSNWKISSAASLCSWTISSMQSNFLNTTDSNFVCFSCTILIW